MADTHPSSSATLNPVAALRQHGQSVWLDFIRRSLLPGGELKRLDDEDGLGGVTSNPAIFEKAIDGSDDYTDAIAELSADPRSRRRTSSSGWRSRTSRTRPTCSARSMTGRRRSTAT